MRLEEVRNSDAASFGTPLDGVRILAAEQMQALPYGTQLLARLGADVVKVEHPTEGESGRGALPAMIDATGRSNGATFLRNNLNKRSVGLDLKKPEGKELFLRLCRDGGFDVVAENFKAGTMDRLGLGYADVAKVNPRIIYLSISGFGNTPTPYDGWPAYAPVVEAMSGIYEYKRPPGGPPIPAPAGALGDIGTSVFGVIGVLAALRHRDATGEGQWVDVAMLDSMVAMTDLVTNFWSMGLRDQRANLIMDGFEASDGWFILQVGREHQFAKLAELVGCPEWVSDERFATRAGWVEHLDDVIRPAIAKWAGGMTKLEACAALSDAGLAAGPCFTAPEVIADEHVASHRMLVELERTDSEVSGISDPVLIPGNPVKMSKVADGPDTPPPTVGEHTDEVLRADLGLDDAELARLREAGVIS
ncbi:MAG: CoA transferase [Actinobacteria bacterium]|nr:CoA transferase [Actinomycetota bacterium]